MAPKRFRGIAKWIVVILELLATAFFVWLIFRLGQVSVE